MLFPPLHRPGWMVTYLALMGCNVKIMDTFFLVTYVLNDTNCRYPKDYDGDVFSQGDFHYHSELFWNRYKSKKYWSETNWQKDIVPILEKFIDDPFTLGPRILMDVRLRNAYQKFCPVMIPRTEIYFELEQFSENEIVGQLRLFRSNKGFLKQVEKYKVGLYWTNFLNAWVQKFGLSNDGIYVCVELRPALNLPFFRDENGLYAVYLK